MIARALISMVAATVFASASYAGDQYVDGTGYAVSGYDVVAYFDLAQSSVGTSQPDGVPGRVEFVTKFNGVTFAFSSQANLDRFSADPTRFVPQFDGHCAYGVAVGNKVPGNPNLWRIVDGKLYLNITKGVARDWEEDIPGYISQAGGEWAGGLERQAASDDRIPKFTSAAPVAE